MTTQLFDWLSQNVPGMSDLHGLPMLVLIAVAALTVCFVIGYAIKGVQTGWQLSRAVRRLQALAATAKARGHAQVDPADIAQALRAEPMRHLWDEYADTLHVQQLAPRDDAPDDPAGGSPFRRHDRRVRATLPAEAFFTREVLVDNRLFDDFTRHLPGVLTGLGIIGTFAGLLDGLGRFDATSTATAVAGLKPLLDGVAHAFSVSALAIGCAMFVTFTSRLCLASFYRQVEALTRVIDGLYATGAGEEYLSRLVASSEKAEGHAAALKASLVDELSAVMTTLAERQIAAQQAAQQALADQLGERIGSAVVRSVGSAIDAQLGPKIGDAIGDRVASAMAVPMNQLGQLARAMKAAQQPAPVVAPAAPPPSTPALDPQALAQAIGASVEGALGRGLAQLDQRLGERLTEHLGERLGERLHEGVATPLREMQQQFDRTLSGLARHQEAWQATMQSAMQSAMQTALQTAAQSSADQQQAAQAAQAQLGDRLQGHLEQAMQQSVTMQTLLLDEIRGFVAHLDASREHANAQARAQGEQWQSHWSSQAQALVGGLSSQTESLVSGLSSQTESLVKGLSVQVEGLLRSMANQGTHTQRQMDQLADMTGQAIAGLNQGASNLVAAAHRFEGAGQSVSGVLERSAATADQLASTTHALQAAAQAVQTGFAQYDQTRQHVDAQVSALNELIGAVRREAGLSQQMLTDLERIVAQLKVAESQSQQYLEGVNRALVRSFEEFGGALTNQLKSTIGDTDRHLSSGVQQLNGVVQHIGLTLSRIRAN